MDTETMSKDAGYLCSECGTKHYPNGHKEYTDLDLFFQAHQGPDGRCGKCSEVIHAMRCDYPEHQLCMDSNGVILEVTHDKHGRRSRQVCDQPQALIQYIRDMVRFLRQAETDWNELDIWYIAYELFRAANEGSKYPEFPIIKEAEEGFRALLHFWHDYTVEKARERDRKFRRQNIRIKRENRKYRKRINREGTR